MLGSPTGSGLPSIAQIAFSCMPCSLPRWIGLVLDGCCIGALPRPVLPRPHWPSRNERPVGIHIFSFEACSSYHSRYGLQSCSPTLRGLCHEAPIRPVTQPNRSSATKAYRQLLGWVLPPLVICAIEAHVRSVFFVRRAPFYAGAVRHTLRRLRTFKNFCNPATLPSRTPGEL